ncbi:hypothetical protein HCN44_007876 [Aphidius gifuensis]|uniref:HYDIN/VesB/CFA65-like Ig-like domain-containing protein n=1 Tax=Aphidius gifuensis TaxID=684658 RepID=A0A834XTV1_APHGI|nr:hypothetical protein HCN44_007876 [Aphidius gifuensis]
MFDCDNIMKIISQFVYQDVNHLKDDVPHLIKMNAKANLVFQITHKGQTLNTKIAPGTYHVYTVKMCAQEQKDYHYEVTFFTDESEERLTVPIIETGPKLLISKIIQVRNVGDFVAVFTLSLSSENFSIEPSHGLIEIGDSAEFVIKFTAYHAKKYTGIILLKYETGELIKIKVHGVANNCDINVDTENVAIDETFIGLSNARSIKITNNTDFIIDYHWMNYQDIETDEKQKNKLKEMFNVVENIEEKRYVNLEQLNICDTAIHTQICKRILADEISSLTTERFSFTDKQFTLSPHIGKIAPQSFAVVNVIFEPKEIGKSSTIAYLEVSGKEKRITVKLSGVSRGPALKFSTSTVEMENVYLKSITSFPISCVNEGLVPGTLIFKSASTDFGGSITITPSCLLIEPNESKIFNLNYLSSKVGDFIEQVDFYVDESFEKLLLYVKGSVKCPKLHCQTRHLNLGENAIGFTSKHYILLENLSPVSVTFIACIPEDGNEIPLTCEKFNESIDISATSIPLNPREFFIHPFQATIDGQNSIKLEINFTPNIIRSENYNLTIEIQDSDSIPLTIPVSFKSIVPKFNVKPQQLNLSGFINFSYTQTFEIINTSDVVGVCYLLQQPNTFENNEKIYYTLEKCQWQLEPGQSTIVPITIITQEIGHHKIELNLMTFGKNESNKIQILCFGHGPIVIIDQKKLNWGNVTLLQEQSMTLKIINDSPISANFKAIISNKNTPWAVLPSFGVIEPHESFDIEVSLFARDVGKQSDKILFAISNTSPQSVSLSAIAAGTPIVLEPNIFPKINMGFLLTECDNAIAVNVMNEGNKCQRLTFTNKINFSNIRGATGKTGVFLVEPVSIELPKKSSKQVVFTARSNTCGVVSEDWCLYGTIEGQGKKQFIGTSTLSANFLEPSISFNQSEFIFFVNKCPNIEENSEKIINELRIINNSEIKLKTRLSVEFPFKISTLNSQKCHKDNIDLNVHEEYLVKIYFSFNDNESSRCSKNYEEFLKIEYENHPKIDYIKCSASINYPNIRTILKPLEFNVPVGQWEEQEFTLHNDGPIEVSNTIFDDGNSLVEIKPNCGAIEAHSIEEFKIISQPIIPGFFQTSFKFELLKMNI